MIWIILTFVFGWLLCSTWSIRMVEKDYGSVEDNQWLFYSLGPIALIIVWFMTWPGKIWAFIKAFAKGVKAEWKKAKKGIQ